MLFFVGSACTDKSSTSIDSFDVMEKIIVCDSIYSDKNDPFGTITNIEIADGVLILKHMGDEYAFSFVDINKKKLLRRWGSKGEGPNEFIDFGSDFTISGSQLVFLSKMKKEINHVPIVGILESKDTLHTVKEPYLYNVDFRPSRLRIVNDKNIFLGSFKEGRFGVLNSENEILNFPSEYPFDCGEIAGIYRGSAFQSKMKSNDKQGKFVISTFSSDVFEIYQIFDTSIHRIFVSPFNYIPQIRESEGRYAVDFDKSIAGLMQMAVSDDLVCFIYSSQSEEEASHSGRMSNEILCFNWNGEKVKKYILPFPISNFCIDNHFIYGVRYQNDETIIYKFKL